MPEQMPEEHHAKRKELRELVRAIPEGENSWEPHVSAAMLSRFRGEVPAGLRQNMETPRQALLELVNFAKKMRTGKEIHERLGREGETIDKPPSERVQLLTLMAPGVHPQHSVAGPAMLEGLRRFMRAHRLHEHQ